MSNTQLLFERSGPIATLTLNRPHAGNAIDLSLARELLTAAIACDEDEGIRCVVLTGAGRYYCTGGDVGGFAAAGDATPSLLKELTAYVHMAVARLARMGKPLVTAVNGPAAGAGISLAALGDLALAARSAHFTLAYTAIGLSPDGGASWLLPRLIGLRRAQELIFTNSKVDADAAADMGLVTRAVDDAALVQETVELARELAAGATAALGFSRRLLLCSFNNGLETHMEAEARAIADASRTAQGREGIAAFIEKRKPDFWPMDGMPDEDPNNGTAA
jgi:2-(1,2-epoxy-1,2-dihydrophenyl)acetyl-CoA isomerase